MKYAKDSSEEFVKDFIEYVWNKYGDEKFSVSEAGNSFFKKRYGTDDDWVDPKNITGTIKRLSEAGQIFIYEGKDVNPKTKRKNKYYRLRGDDE